jgi:protein required for attachment to host cells
MKTTWILIANAHRARCFARQQGEHGLVELADFVNPRVEQGILKEQRSKGHGRTGHAGTQFEASTNAQTKQRHDFAKRLADYLNRGVNDHLCDSLVLIATSPMLGELRPCLTDAAGKMLEQCIAGDFTSYLGPDLESRVERALALPN